MVGSASTGEPGIEAFLAAVSMTPSDVARAAGRFEGGLSNMLRSSLQTAERAFAELNACHDKVDWAADQGMQVAARLRELLAGTSREVVEDVAGCLDSLRDLAEEVERSEDKRLFVDRILGRTATTRETFDVPALQESQLPVISEDFAPEPSVDLLGFTEHQERVRPFVEAAHAERIDRVAEHLVGVVEVLAKTGFADRDLVHASMAEVDRAFALLQMCLRQRNRDLA